MRFRKTLGKAVLWTAGILIGLFLIFAVYPDLSETTKWNLGIAFVVLSLIYHVNKADESRRSWRFGVLEDLKELKRQLDRLERIVLDMADRQPPR